MKAGEENAPAGPAMEELDRNHPLSIGMWAGFVDWAIGEEEMRR